MKLEVFNIKNQNVGDIEVSDVVFGAEIKPHLHHEVVKYQLAKRRAGTHSTLTRAQVTGTTKKMYRQKGTGNARHGNRKVHTMPGGGVAFGPKPRNYAYSLPRKVRRNALRSVLSEAIQMGTLKVVESFQMDAPKTKIAADILTTLQTPKALVIDVDNKALGLSLRNMPKAKFLSTDGLNVYDILRYERVVITKKAMTVIEERLTR